jgi:hypothetical protein
VRIYNPTEAEMAKADAIVRQAIADCRAIIEAAVEKLPEEAGMGNGSLAADTILDRLTAELLDEGEVREVEGNLMELMIAFDVQMVMDLGEDVYRVPMMRHFYRADRMLLGKNWVGEGAEDDIDE